MEGASGSRRAAAAHGDAAEQHASRQRPGFQHSGGRAGGVASAGRYHAALACWCFSALRLFMMRTMAASIACLRSLSTSS